MVGVRDSLEEALPGENSRNAHQAGQNGHGSHHVAGLGDFVKAGVLFTAGGTAAGSAGHLVTALVALAVLVVVNMRLCRADLIAVGADIDVGIVINIIANEIVTNSAADITFAVFIFVYTIGDVSTTGVGAFVGAFRNIMFCVRGISAYIADAVFHTDMFAPFNSREAVGTLTPVAIIIVIALSIGMLALDHNGIDIFSAHITQAVLVVVIMGFRLTETGKTLNAHFYMRFAVHQPAPAAIVQTGNTGFYSTAYSALVRS